MSNLYQLTYASESNVGLDIKGVNPEVGRILAKSKNNNAQLKVGGVLYYADGYFFQVLEGEKETVQRLYEKLSTDNRHSHVKVLKEGYIEEAQFNNWSMHLVPAKSSIRRLLKDYGLNSFKPFNFSQQLIDMLIQVLSLNGHYKPAATSPSNSSKQGIFSRIKRIFS